MALQEEFEKQGIWLFRYRSYLPLIILVFGGFFYVYAKMNPKSFLLANTSWEPIYNCFCLLVGILGLYVRIYTVGHTPANTSGRNVKEQVADELNSTGIYSVVRHPLYLGNFLMWLSPALLTGNFWFVLAFCLLYWVYYERIMFAEEQFLRRKFGEKYTSWAEGAPAFWPRLSSFKKPAYPFSMKKVLKKEKNGLAALFLIFCLFNFVGKWLTKDLYWGWYDYFIAYSCGFAVVVYLILKYLKRKTHVLDEQGR